MSILDMQGMDAADRCGGGDSGLSLAACVSEASVSLCL